MKINKNTIIATLCVFSMATFFTKSIVIYADEEPNSDDDEVIVVSMGDSYSSGEGISPYYGEKNFWTRIARYDDVHNEEFLAHRSTKSWPGQLQVSGLEGTLESHKDVNWFFTAISGDTTDGLREKGIKKSNFIH